VDTDTPDRWANSCCPIHQTGHPLVESLRNPGPVLAVDLAAGGVDTRSDRAVDGGKTVGHGRIVFTGLPLPTIPDWNF
jgi:hypothetical protein